MIDFEMSAISSSEKAYINAWLERLAPQQTLQWIFETFGQDLVMTSSFGMNGVMLIHMLHQISQELPIIFIDTGHLFQETLETKRRIEAAYGVDVLTSRSNLSLDAQNRQYGYDLPTRNPDLCCKLRKVEPMQKAMIELQPVAVLNGRARFQARTRRDLPIIEWEESPIRINPLALWSQKRIQSYVKSNAVPYNSLYDKGYSSIGCRPCTRPVLKSEHVRAGRWAGLGKTECGLWTTSYATAV